MGLPAATPSGRVVVTGFGVVSATATGRVEFARALRAGERGIGPVTLFDVSDQRSQIAAEVKNFDAVSVLPPALRGIGSRSDALGIVAAEEALRHAGLDSERWRSTGIVVGGTTGGNLETETYFAGLQLGRPMDVPRARLLSHPLNAPADHIACALGLHGSRRTVCTACSSGVNAIAVASDLLRRGACSAVLAGGTDALCRLTYSGFNALGAVDPDPCRPFDVARAGLNLGEGAAFLVLERIEDARARGASVVAEVLGVGVASEAHHITNPQASGQGAARAMQLALRDAGLSARDVSYVNAHGTGTVLNDAMETNALETVFGEHVGQVYVSSTKSLVGHTLGAAGAIEAVVCLLAIEHGFVPATAGTSEIEPSSRLRHVLGHSIDARVAVCLSNSFGFGGTDSVVCLGRPEFGDGHERVRTRMRSVVITGLGAVLTTGSRSAGIDAALGRAGTDDVIGSEHSPIASVGAALDATRARRLDRFARMAADSAAQALDDGGYRVCDATRVGASLGTAWGSLDATVAFIRRVAERGARMAPPADFPNLVLSAAVGHLSIYHGLEGPTLTAAALTVSGEHALLMASEEIVSHRADAMLAGASEEKNPLVLRLIDESRVFLHGRDAARASRAEGSVCVLLEDEESARARGSRPIARLAAWHEATYPPEPEGLDDGGADLASAVERAVQSVLARVHRIDAVVVPLATPALRDGIASALGRYTVLFEVAPRAGFFESIGMLAVAAAARLLARDDAYSTVLAVGTAPGAACAIALVRP